MNQVSPTAFQQLRAGKTLIASGTVSSVDCSPHGDEAEESSSSLTKLANSAYTSWLSNGSPSYGV